jgi:hypothetical protein
MHLHVSVPLTPAVADKSLAAREGGGGGSAEDAAEVESLYLTACMHLGRAHDVDASSAAALNNWGASLSKFARRKGREEALPLLQESILKHRSCLAIESANAEYACNLADTIAEMAALLSGADSDTLYREAYGIWDQVLLQLQGTAHISDRCDATVNYGNALAAHAARLSDEGNRCVNSGAENFIGVFGLLWLQGGCNAGLPCGGAAACSGGVPAPQRHRIPPQPCRCHTASRRVRATLNLDPKS